MRICPRALGLVLINPRARELILASRELRAIFNHILTFFPPFWPWLEEQVIS
jgi:hypothetical protein